MKMWMVYDETGYMAMIRTEDITMIQVKPVTDQAKKVNE